MPDDTLGLIIQAHEQITRENSPIENVVLDLSNNTGGDVDAAVFVLGWLLGEAPFSVKDMSTGAMSTSVYRADVNLDRTFDEKDTVLDKNLYCLISPVSFSCGNLVPAALKSSQKVTLLGRTSGGSRPPAHGEPCSRSPAPCGCPSSRTAPSMTSTRGSNRTITSIISRTSMTVPR